MVNLEKLPKENLYAFFDGSQYDGSEYWYDSINKVKATVKNGYIGKDDSVFLPFDEKKGFMNYISIPYSSNIPASFSAYALLKVDKPKKISTPTNPPYEQVQLFRIGSGYNTRFFLLYYSGTDLNADSAIMYCELPSDSYYGVLTRFPHEEYCLLTLNVSAPKQTGFLNTKKLNDKKTYGNWSGPRGPIYIGTTGTDTVWTNISVKAILIYQEIKNEEQIEKIHNFFADSYNMPELLSEEKLVAKIPRLDSIAIAAALEANYSRHKSFKQVVNSYRKGVSF
jgi:hypothetical protein